MIRLSFDKFRFRTPLDYDRTPLDLHQTSGQPPILLRNTSASQASTSRSTSQYNSIRPLAPFPRSQRDLGLDIHGVKNASQVSTPCYTARQDLVVNEEDNDSKSTPSPSHTDMAHQQGEKNYYHTSKPPIDHKIMVIKRDFILDLVALRKEFDFEGNKVKREAYRANHTKEQKVKVLQKWKEFMKEISSHVPFFEYLENHFEWHKKSCVITKTNWMKDETKEVVRSSHPPLEKITFKHKNASIVAPPLPSSHQ